MQNINDDMKFKLMIIIVISLVFLVALKKVIIYFLNKKPIKIAQRVVIGREEIQEDNIRIVSEPYGTLAVLGDGFGLNEAGRTASLVSVDTIARMFQREETSERFSYFFKKSFNKANHEVMNRIEEGRGGASVTSAIISDGNLYYGLVGNVMLAIYRNKELVRLSEGHNMSEVAKKEYQKGNISKEDAIHTIKNDKVLYYVGQEPFNHLEICDVPIKLYKNDMILVMSKGIYENIRWVDLEEILKEQKNDIEEACDIIVENTNQKVNGSIILMKYCCSK